MSLRLLTLADLPQAQAIAASAGWNQTAADWTNLLELAPETCFGIELDGCLAATATLVSYGPLAWLGMVLTRQDYQHRGLASRLVTHVLDVADRAGVLTVKLDATEQGRPIYERLGFVAERAIERWSGNGRACGTLNATSAPLTGVKELDGSAFGADRMGLLRRLALGAAPVIANGGFAFWRPGRIANYFGPCVAATPEIAQCLLAASLARAAGVWFWDIFPDNAAASALARESGFQPVRHLTRMRRGPGVAERPELVYAAAGFEVG